MAGAFLRQIEAFTVLEMIVTITIVSLLFGIFIFRLRGIQDQQRIEMTRGDIRALQTAVNAYYLHHKDANGKNVYPSGDDWQANDLINDNPRVLRQILYDPFQPPATEYRYTTSPNLKYYVVFSVGSNGTADISGINDEGGLSGNNVDDIFVSNGTGTFAKSKELGMLIQKEKTADEAII